MNRRSIFKSLLATPFLAVGAREVQAAPEHLFPGIPGGMINRAAPSRFDYGQWRAYWTGWKSSQGSPDLCSQWVASAQAWPFSLYVSNPGAWGVAFPGCHFDCGWRHGQVLTTSLLSFGILNSVREEMRWSLIRLIDHAEANRWCDISPERLRPGFSDPSIYPVTNPELADASYRHHWKRLSPQLIADILAEERRNREYLAKEMDKHLQRVFRIPFRA